MSFWVGAYTILNTHSIDAMCVCGVDFGSKIFYFLERFFLLLEHLTNLVLNIVEGLVVVDAMLLLMGSAVGDGRLGPGRILAKIAQLTLHGEIINKII